ncbi:MAG: PilZ domain-containing protein [Polyangiaceae bacterium]
MRRPQLRYVPRRPTRHEIRIPCEVVRERDFKLVASETLDLSERGLLVRTRLPVLTGESLFLSFMAPFTRTFIDAEAVVARIVHGRRLADEGPAIGIEIVQMDGITEAMLRQHLSLLPTVGPVRRGLVAS